ncbi:MAG: 7-cyano-7-deazaguanine synthase QueC [Planctomycetia bacterium]|nr:7-cyano-7-deazaguanine synthase QueC [Planctomycetia bacterium]
MSKPAVVLLSGGLDSATVLAIAKSQGYVCHAISFDYGQRHRVELQAASRIAQSLKVASHRIIEVNMRAIGGSALTDDIAVPVDRDDAAMSHSIPITYVPARNTIFLSLALGLAEVVIAFDIFVGVNAVDYSGYPDCRQEYLNAFQHLANLATKAGVENRGRFQIHAPLVKMSKADIIRTGTELKLDYRVTISCYQADEYGLACGHCDSCQLRRKGFEEAGLPDATRYRDQA